MRLVFLYGPPAAGKLTIGRLLAERAGFALFHNHLVVNAVSAVFPFGSPEFVRLRECWWLEMIDEAAKAGRSIIFTFQPEPSVHSAFPDGAAAIVREAGGEVLFVRLVLSHAGQRSRIANESRAAFGKLRCPELLDTLAESFATCEAAMPEPVLTIDTDAVSVETATALILRLLGSPGA